MPKLRAIPSGPSDEAAWLAIAAHDARFDGRLFVGVTSTGIYCRPVCRVKTPSRRHCRFYANAASAEQAGFRPCLRCRPELAPGLSFVDSSKSLAIDAARRMQHQVLNGQVVSPAAVAERLGVTDRHLRRIFQAEHGVSPQNFLSTQRLLLAKQLLTDTPLPITQVALASGFGSLRRFNAAFLERYRLQPSSLRRRAGGEGESSSPAASLSPTPTRSPSQPLGHGTDPGITVQLPFRPPYDVDGMLRFLARREVAGLEKVDAGQLTFRRTLSWRQDGTAQRGWLSARLRPERHSVTLQLSTSLVPVLGAVVQRVRQAFDLDAEPSLVDPLLATLPGRAVPGLRVPGAMDGFESALRVILGQQITVTAARTLTQRLVLAMGEPISTPWAGLTHTMPSAERLANASAEDIGKLGIVRQRVRAIQSLARAVADGGLALHPAAPLQATMQALRDLPGIGEWTVQLIAMRALAWPDAFPASDLGVLEALKPLTNGQRDAKAAEGLSQAWRPWRSYAVMHLWLNLESQPDLPPTPQETPTS